MPTPSEKVLIKFADGHVCRHHSGTNGVVTMCHPDDPAGTREQISYQALLSLERNGYVRRCPPRGGAREWVTTPEGDARGGQLRAQQAPA